MNACSSPDEPRFTLDPQGREVPHFSEENAYEYIEKQVSFGPRYPGSEGHAAAGSFLRERLESYAGTDRVFVQSFDHEGYDGETFTLHNLIAAFNVENPNRILLAAHWDTRPRGEEDPYEPEKPIPGADDGGSGVGVLLELARLFREVPPPVGVDIILFDGEDYGHAGDLDQFFLGARHWSLNPPVENYRPRFAILLDMVGGVDAVFPKEGYSMRYAPTLVDAVWQVAAELGFEERFPDRDGALIADDHMIVNRYTDIPMINIIHHDRSDAGGAVFPPYWHSQQDDMEIIDRETLRIVGTLMAELIYNRVN